MNWKSHSKQFSVRKWICIRLKGNILQNFRTWTSSSQKRKGIIKPLRRQSNITWRHLWRREQAPSLFNRSELAITGGIGSQLWRTLMDWWSPEGVRLIGRNSKGIHERDGAPESRNYNGVWTNSGDSPPKEPFWWFAPSSDKIGKWITFLILFLEKKLN